MKFLWGALVASWLIIAAMVYMFFIKGNVAQASDGRTAVILTQGEKDIVLEEMRGFLNGVQLILEGLDEKDMKKVAQSAKAIGTNGVGELPGSLVRKLPLPFKQLGHPTHKAFDELAIEATDLGDEKLILKKLASTTNNCVTCHAAYKLEVEKK